MDLVESIYRATRDWPKEEVYGLTSQARRAAVSVPSNGAEGQGRTGAKEFLHHLSIANGSLREVETHVLIAARPGYVDELTCEALFGQTAQVGRILPGLMRSLRPSVSDNQ